MASDQVAVSTLFSLNVSRLQRLNSDLSRSWQVLVLDSSTLPRQLHSSAKQRSAPRTRESFGFRSFNVTCKQSKRKQGSQTFRTSYCILKSRSVQLIGTGKDVRDGALGDIDSRHSIIPGSGMSIYCSRVGDSRVQGNYPSCHWGCWWSNHHLKGLPESEGFAWSNEHVTKV
eukprot:s1706_g8.t1